MLAAALPVAVRAQANEKKPQIPKPPVGMCRIWVDGVPANKQPAPTDCSTALHNKPTNGQVIFGDSKATPRGVAGSAAARMMPPIANGFSSQRGSKSSGKADRDTGKSRHDSAKTGRDSGKTSHDSSGKKPPPPRYHH
jgi:hypothetical protein